MTGHQVTRAGRSFWRSSHFRGEGTAEIAKTVRVADVSVATARTARCGKSDLVSAVIAWADYGRKVHRLSYSLIRAKPNGLFAGPRVRWIAGIMPRAYCGLVDPPKPPFELDGVVSSMVGALAILR